MELNQTFPKLQGVKFMTKMSKEKALHSALLVALLLGAAKASLQLATPSENCILYLVPPGNAGNFIAPYGTALKSNFQSAVAQLVKEAKCSDT